VRRFTACAGGAGHRSPAPVQPSLGGGDVASRTSAADRTGHRQGSDRAVRRGRRQARRAPVGGLYFEQPSRNVENAAARVRVENDWVSEQVAQYPDRLIGFCGLNPLKDYALDELARCAKDHSLRNGLKLHFGNSVVDYHDPRHLAQVERVFRAANRCRMPIVVHIRATFNSKLPYGRDEARIFLERLVPAAPDVVIQGSRCGSSR
jgi:predicted TIM-barrel fold metal-dependent hydrolase